MLRNLVSIFMILIFLAATLAIIPDFGGQPLRFIFVDAKEIRPLRRQFAYTYHERELIKIGQIMSMDENAGEVLFYPFPGMGDFVSDYKSAVILENNFANLWKLQSKSSKAKILDRTKLLTTLTRETLIQTLNSNVFRTKYENRLTDLLQESLKKTMAEPSMEESQEEALSEVNRILTQNLGLDLGNLLHQALWKAFKEEIGDSPTKIMGFLATGDWDIGLMRITAGYISENPLFRRGMEQSFRDLFASPKIKHFLKQLFTQTLAHCFEHPSFFSIIEEMAADPEIVDSFKPLTDEAALSGKTILIQLLTTDGGKRIDPFAAKVIQRIIFNKDPQLVLFLTETQSRVIENLGFTFLEPTRDSF